MIMSPVTLYKQRHANWDQFQVELLDGRSLVRFTLANKSSLILKPQIEKVFDFSLFIQFQHLSWISDVVLNV